MPLQAVIGNAALKKAPKVNNPWTDASLSSWFAIVREGKKPYLPITWIAYDPGFMPNVSDGKFKQWARYGLTIYDNLYDNKGRLKHFGDLKNIYDLDKKDLSVSSS